MRPLKRKSAELERFSTSVSHEKRHRAADAPLPPSDQAREHWPRHADQSAESHVQLLQERQRQYEERLLETKQRIETLK